MVIIFKKAGNQVKSYIIKTFGCQMNEHDSEILAGMLESLGYCPAGTLSEAAVILLNTCCVRETAENKIFSFLGRLRPLKKENPSLIIGVCGCMSQKENMAQRIRQLFPYVDLLFGTHNIHQLPELIGRLEQKREPVFEVWTEARNNAENLPVKRGEGVRAWVNIMYGCNNFCTYCIVPYVRGRERSRQLNEVINEVRGLGEQGYKEIILLGQNVNSYGKDLEEPVDFADLLYELDKIEEIKRIRYMTSHPRDFTEKLIKVVAGSEKVCDHFHLPVQAGSNRVLKNMNRGYTRESYLELIQKIRLHLTLATITTDIIVGFPGEGEDEYQETIDLLKQARFDSAYTFVFNPRAGTQAALMEEQVPEEEKKDRIRKLIEFQNSISMEKNKEEEGEIQDVLVEGESAKNPGFMCGRNKGNKMVVFKGKPELTGSLVEVAIITAHLAQLDGVLLQKRNSEIKEEYSIPEV